MEAAAHTVVVNVGACEYPRMRKSRFLEFGSEADAMLDHNAVVRKASGTRRGPQESGTRGSPAVASVIESQDKRGIKQAHC